MWNRNLDVSHSTLAELRTLDLGGKWSGKFPGTVIPTLAEILATIPVGKKIYVEIKTDASIISGLLDVVSKSGLQAEQVVIISFNSAVLRILKDKAPELKTLWLYKPAYEAGDAIYPILKMVLETLYTSGADGVSTDKSLNSALFVQDVIFAGYEHHVWTVNDLKVGREFMLLGTSSITTDVPAMLAPLNSSSSEIPTETASALLLHP